MAFCSSSAGVRGLGADCLEDVLGACLFVAFEGPERSWLHSASGAMKPRNASALEITNRGMLEIVSRRFPKIKKSAGREFRRTRCGSPRVRRAYPLGRAGCAYPGPQSQRECRCECLQKPL